MQSALNEVKQGTSNHKDYFIIDTVVGQYHIQTFPYGHLNHMYRYYTKHYTLTSDLPLPLRYLQQEQYVGVHNLKMV